MDTTILKILYLIIIFIICFIGGIIPKYFKNNAKALSYSNCLGAGILLGASFLHILSESETKISNQFPSSHLFYFIGFFGSFILERILFEHKHDHLSNEDNIDIFDNELKELKPESPVITSLSQTEDTIVTINESLDLESDDHYHNDKDEHTKKEEEEEDKHQHKHNKGKGFPFMLFSVLALESIVSGSALGVEDDKVSIFVTFLAISTHIWAESFALTATVLKSTKNSKTVFKSVLLFSMMTPIGGVVGLISEKLLSREQSNIISGLLLALAGGCFLYVSIFEIMVEEFQDSHGDEIHHKHDSSHHQRGNKTGKLDFEKALNEKDDKDIQEFNFNDINNIPGTPSKGYQKLSTSNKNHKHSHFSIPVKWKKTILLISGFTFMALLRTYE
ncbi:hypothetical protein DLAC_09598 [Tieghemostelium lacteum]|uniref:Zinc/iron permease n=1 Tax=Tieghemostelium lacteum TaxID=361077 RepID=A0A151Z6P7_TIELA|nr:hypothetical protein DLAC_09598 [Tieghemostelium lacteum]|eukprot:KYQ89633.1 hypothetical protein DLAC_09598 [Tieghemostelium lacteum]